MRNSNLPDEKPRTVRSIATFQAGRTWPTKSGGELTVPLILSKEHVGRYFTYDSNELGRINGFMEGFRIYTVRKLPKDRIGGTEFHRIREEIVIGIDGEVEFTCEDVFGGREVFSVSTGRSLWIPPFTLHTYLVKEDNSGLFVLANTLFDPDNPETHDTYSEEEFREMKRRYWQKNRQT